MTAHMRTHRSHEDMEGFEGSPGATSSRSTGGGEGAGQGGDGSFGSGDRSDSKPSAFAEEVASLVLASLRPQLDSFQAQFDALKAPVEEAYNETLLQKSERLNQRRRVYNRDVPSAGQLEPIYNHQCRLPAEHNALLADPSQLKPHEPALIPPVPLDLSLVSTLTKLFKEGVDCRYYDDQDGEEVEEEYDTLDPSRFDPLLLFYGVKLEGKFAPDGEGDVLAKRNELGGILGRGWYQMQVIAPLPGSLVC